MLPRQKQLSQEASPQVHVYREDIALRRTAMGGQVIRRLIRAVAHG